MAPRSLSALACLTGAALWPAAYDALQRALMSPLERALRDSYCGEGLHTGFASLGHCAACWTGSALLVAAAAVLVSRSRKTAFAST